MRKNNAVRADGGKLHVPSKHVNVATQNVANGRANKLFPSLDCHPIETDTGIYRSISFIDIDDGVDPFAHCVTSNDLTNDD